MKSLTRTSIGLLILWIILACFYIPSCISIEQDIESPLKKAADAPNIEGALIQLEKANKNIKSYGYDTGSSHIFYRTEETDLGVWSKQLLDLQTDLESSNSTTLSRLEESNVLMKARETILDHSKDGTKVTIPPNLITYPFTFLTSLFYILSVLVLGAVTLIIGLILD